VSDCSVGDCTPGVVEPPDVAFALWELLLEPQAASATDRAVARTAIRIIRSDLIEPPPLLVV
jgi:hypothetical protein